MSKLQRREIIPMAAYAGFAPKQTRPAPAPPDVSTKPALRLVPKVAPDYLWPDDTTITVEGEMVVVHYGIPARRFPLWQWRFIEARKRLGEPPQDQTKRGTLVSRPMRVQTPRGTGSLCGAPWEQHFRVVLDGEKTTTNFRDPVAIAQIEPLEDQRIPERAYRWWVNGDE